MQQYFVVYRVTNKLNNRVYVGVHKTADINDRYFGSGVAISAAIKKYGEANFEKETLAVFDNADEMFAMEAEIVNEAFVVDKTTYNMQLGGGCYPDRDGHRTSEEVSAAARKAAVASNRARHKRRQCDPEYDERCRANSSRAIKAALAKKDCSGENASFYGKRHSAETRAKMRVSAKGKHTGEKNSQYGTCWIFSNKEKRSKRIKRDELDDHLRRGWEKGRKMKFD